VISVEINDQKVELSEGSILREAFEITNTRYIPGTTIGIIKGAARKEEITTEYRLTTTKGEIRLEMIGGGINETWLKYHDSFSQASVRWAGPEAVAFGPVETDIIPTRSEREYNKYDVVFGAGGYDAKYTHLIFSRSHHMAAHGAPEQGAFARVISGKSVLANLSHGDSLTKIEPIVRWEMLLDKKATQDLSMRLEDNMKIFTYFHVELIPEAPEGAEHFLGIIGKNIFNVDSFSNTYVSDDALKGEGCPYENWDAREAGTVVVRSDGFGLGRIYIYKEDRTSSSVHSVVGRVIKGLELIKLAELRNKLEVRASPERILLLGMSFSQAERLLESRGIKIERTGYLEEDAVIAEQNPDTTLGIIKAGMVKALGVHPNKILGIKLYDGLAPKTLDFFRHSLRLKDRPLGPLPVYYVYENTVLFKAAKGAEAYKEITPENTPENLVKAGEIGVTNQAAKRYGLIGVKLTDDNRYGPSGEKFECTNIIGRIIELSKLKDLKAGDTVYVREI